MKIVKLMCLLLCVCTLFCLAACNKADVTSPPDTEAVASDEEDEKGSPDVAEIETLQLEKTVTQRKEWNDSGDTLLVDSEYSNVFLSEKDAALYPELSESLDVSARLQKNAMEDEADNFLAFAKEELDSAYKSFETYVSTLDVQVRRADGRAVSLLEISYADHGEMNGFTGMFGSTFDTERGRELALSDVIKDVTKIPELVGNELNAHPWAAQLYSETAVADYFADTPEDGIRWTLDYSGITFYFLAGELAPEGFGAHSVTLGFGSYPDLFEEKYTAVPDAYMARLAMNSSYYTDLDGDGETEELFCSGIYDELGFYYDFALYTDTGTDHADQDGHYYSEEIFALDFLPYYVKTADGDSYLYMFCEPTAEPDHEMQLIVFGLNETGFTRVGQTDNCIALIASDRYMLPCDPDEFYLDVFEDPEFISAAFTVGEDGMPVRK